MVLPFLNFPSNGQRLVQNFIFDTVGSTCKLRTEWCEVKFSLEYTPNCWKIGPDVIRMTVNEATEMEIVLTQELFTLDRILARQYDDLCVVILRENGKRGKLAVAASTKRRAEGAKHLKYFIQPGNYVIVPILLKPWSPTRNKEAVVPRGSISIYSEWVILAEKIKGPATILTDALIHLALDKGEEVKFDKTITLEKARCFFLSSQYFNGLLMMMENFSRFDSIQVDLQCSMSSNVVSSRGSLYTIDAVPPRHRQILNILTQDDHNRGYEINYNLQYSRQAFAGLLDRVRVWSKPPNVPIIREALRALHDPRPIAE